ncbi:MAG: hypothetical protein SVX43_19135 [Cyanobacteriota bacterium]|nr:hypothetical protein [Cyanobacteriota bacterium]
MDIKAIPTQYNNIVFRSRLEARWAVFWDTLGIKYFYEYEGFKLSSGWYVPDFWLPDFTSSYLDDSDTVVNSQGIWIEVKGRELTLAEQQIAEELCEKTKKMVYFLSPEVLTNSPTSFEGTQGSMMNYWAEREPQHLYKQRIEAVRAVDRGKISWKEYEEFLEAYEVEWKNTPGEIIITADPGFRDPVSNCSLRLNYAYRQAQTYRFY